MSYTSSDVKEFLGVKVDRLQDWVNRGYVTPSIQQASGQGTKNLYSRDDLILIALFRKLVNRDSTRDAAGRIIKAIRHCGEPFSDFFLFAEDIHGPDSIGITEYHHVGRMLTVGDLGTAIDALHGDFDTAMVISLKRIADLVDSKIG